MAAMMPTGKIAGIKYYLTSDTVKFDTTLTPDESDMLVVPDESIVSMWSQAAKWRERFVENNPGWKINGRKPIET